MLFMFVIELLFSFLCIDLFGIFVFVVSTLSIFTLGISFLLNVVEFSLECKYALIKLNPPKRKNNMTIIVVNAKDQINGFIYGFCKLTFIFNNLLFLK